MWKCFRARLPSQSEDVKRSFRARFPTVKLEDGRLRGQGLNDQSPSAHSGKSRRKLRFYIFHEGSLARRLCDRLVTVWIESGVIAGLQAATCGACGAQSHPRSEI